jgi:hypothetical protein
MLSELEILKIEIIQNYKRLNFTGKILTIFFVTIVFPFLFIFNGFKKLFKIK